MREMKDSGIEWIGEIPASWQTTKIKYLADIRNESHAFDPETDHYIGLENVQSYDNNIISTNSQYDASFQKVCHKGDVLFGKLRPYLAKVIIAPFDGFCTGEFLQLRHFKGDRRFLRYFMLSDGFIEHVSASTYGTKMPRASTEFIINLMMPNPAITDQENICNFLDQKCAEIDTLTSDIETQIETLEQYKRSVITKAVTKGLDPDVEMKDSGVAWIGEIPSSWTIKRLKYILSEPMKYGATESGVDFDESMPRYIRITDINEDGGLKSNGKLSLTKFQANGYMLKDGAILFARSGATVGKAFMYRASYGPAAFAGYLISAYINKSLSFPEWLLYFTQSSSYWVWVHRAFSQATIQNIGADKYSNMPIPIAPLYKQRVILDYLDRKCAEIDSIIADKRTQLDTLAEYKKSLIYEYVTGKKEVPSA